jgi:hypothetical protein
LPPSRLLPYVGSAMQPDTRRLHARAVNRAGVLARSGAYEGWQAIEAALLAEGHAIAKEALRSRYLRNLLAEHCVEARRGNPA